MRLPPRDMKRVRMSTSSWAETSFLPPWRAISTEKVKPFLFATESIMARATSR